MLTENTVSKLHEMKLSVSKAKQSTRKLPAKQKMALINERPLIFKCDFVL
jgi:hypothetical protein